MLELINVKKDYNVAGGAVHALKGISLKFRKNEFVSILGASGCGKTTLLNIIGGLDKYTSGDLIIEGRSTKEYDDGDWDTYRNHSIGFIFQSYHLIPHQTILQNVELALTISGVGRDERRRRALEALEKVGLADKVHNRPNQLSGGQAQRVAIARALINDPEIVLADEPTGALDSKTSVQIMELLKEISRDRLVIMVTHNPELAESYSTRIIRLLDGEVTDDTRPYDGAEETVDAASEPAEERDAAADAAEKSKGRKKKSSMPFTMSFMLSLKNLLSKWKRTLMVSVAGSIGIIGVSMVLAISAGVQGYIASMEDDMLSGYPLTVSAQTINFDALMDMTSSSGTKIDPSKLGDKIYVDSVISSLMKMSSTMVTNDITQDYIDYVEAMPKEYYNALQYKYGFEPANNVYTNFKLDANDAGEEVSVAGMRAMYTSVVQEVAKRENDDKYNQFAQIIPTVQTFSELPNNYSYILSQYDILASNIDKTTGFTDSELKEIFESRDSMIMVVNDKATADLYLGQFGYFTQEEFLKYAERAKSIADGDNDTSEYDSYIQSYLDGKEYDFFLDKGGEYTFKWYPNDSVYRKLTPAEAMAEQLGVPSGTGYELAPYTYNAYSADFKADRDKSNDVELKVKVILQKKKNISYGCLNTGFYYTQKLTEHTLKTGRESAIVNYIYDECGGELKGLPYKYHYTYDGVKNNATTFLMDVGMSSMMSSMMGGGSTDPYESLKVKPSFIGGGKLPVSLGIYPLDFDNKDYVTNYLDKWNDACERADTPVYEKDGEKIVIKAGADGSLKWTEKSGEVVKSVKDLDEKQFKDVIYSCRTASLKGSKILYLAGGEEYEVQLVGTFDWTDKDGNARSLLLTDTQKIEYTDTVGLIITMVNVMIQMITIALIAFTALSLVVSTVMVGIITYVSVVERIKEIGILRAVGARKKDIKRLFNAETFIIGLVAGAVGIGVTYLFSLILNAIVASLAPVTAIAALPWWQALVMVGVSVVLTLVSGLIPASAAAKKDPVVALRTE